jgi:hypothetical protein
MDHEAADSGGTVAMSTVTKESQKSPGIGNRDQGSALPKTTNSQPQKVMSNSEKIERKDALRKRNSKSRLSKQDEIEVSDVTHPVAVETEVEVVQGKHMI